MDFSFLSDYYSYFFTGIKYTLLLALLSVAIGSIGGSLIALMKLSKVKILKVIASIYIEIIRGTPIYVQILIAYSGLAALNLTPFQAGLIAVSLNSCAYTAEIIRGGIESVDKGQAEAARSLGLDEKATLRYVVFPQAVKNILPSLGNEFITVIKESSIASVIGFKEIMYNNNIVMSTTFKSMEPLLVSAAIYFVLTFTLSRAVALFERKLKASD